MQAVVVKWLIGIGLAAAACITIYVLILKNDIATRDRDRALEAVDAYKSTLDAYQDSFSNQVKTLNGEKRREIQRQERLLKTLTIIGDLPDESNGPVPSTSLPAIDSLYGE